MCWLFNIFVVITSEIVVAEVLHSPANRRQFADDQLAARI